MPTFNRRAFVPMAIKCFLAQDYPEIELIIVDDGTDRVADLIPNDPRIRYVPLEAKIKLGLKRNYANEQSKGEFIINWDDDDWSSPLRVTRQVQPMIDNPLIELTGTSQIFYFTFGQPREKTLAYIYSSTSKPPWLGGIAYRRSVWERLRFDDGPRVGEDTRFQNQISIPARYDIKDPALFVAGVHRQNDSPKHTHGPGWGSIPALKVQQVFGAQLH